MQMQETHTHTHSNTQILHRVCKEKATRKYAKTTLRDQVLYLYIGKSLNKENGITTIKHTN